MFQMHGVGALLVSFPDPQYGTHMLEVLLKVCLGMRLVLYQASPVTVQLLECGCLGFHVLYTYWGKPVSPTLVGLHSKDTCMSVCLVNFITAGGNNLHILV